MVVPGVPGPVESVAAPRFVDRFDLSQRSAPPQKTKGFAREKMYGFGQKFYARRSGVRKSYTYLSRKDKTGATASGRVVSAGTAQRAPAGRSQP